MKASKFNVCGIDSGVVFISSGLLRETLVYTGLNPYVMLLCYSYYRSHLMSVQFRLVYNRDHFDPMVALLAGHSILSMNQRDIYYY